MNMKLLMKENCEEFFIASVLKILAFVELIGGLIVGIMIGGGGMPFSWNIAWMIWITCLINALMLFAFGTALQMLYDIKERKYELEVNEKTAVKSDNKTTLKSDNKKIGTNGNSVALEGDSQENTIVYTSIAKFDYSKYLQIINKFDNAKSIYNYLESIAPRNDDYFLNTVLPTIKELVECERMYGNNKKDVLDTLEKLYTEK